MSLTPASTRQASSLAFGHLTRLFMAMKRHGRLIDVIWFQHSPEYARAIIAVAEAIDEPALQETLASVRESFADHLAPAMATPPRAATALGVTAVDGPIEEPDGMPVRSAPLPEVDPQRYVGGLR